ncbi:MAG: ParB/RepB/Spo0J family partition protein, partial [Gallionella sp.]
SRSAASNLLRLLKLSQPVQEMLMMSKLDMGHARALLGLEGADQISAANQIVLEQMSVRDAETLVQNWAKPKQTKNGNNSSNKQLDRDVERLQEQLADTMGTTVLIKHGSKGSGKLVISYTSNDHLEELIARIK